MTNDVSPQLLLAFLNDAWNRASTDANSLYATLLADQSAALAFIKQGSIAAVGKNSANQSYRGYGAGSLTHVQIVEAIGNLIGLYDQLKLRITDLFEDNTADWPDGVPATFDFDLPVYNVLKSVFSAQSAGRAPMLPDLRDIRIPLLDETPNTADRVTVTA